MSWSRWKLQVRAYFWIIYRCIHLFETFSYIPLFVHLGYAILVYYEIIILLIQSAGLCRDLTFLSLKLQCSHRLVMDLRISCWHTFSFVYCGPLNFLTVLPMLNCTCVWQSSLFSICLVFVYVGHHNNWEFIIFSWK